MAIIQRTGTYGIYYTSEPNTSTPLNSTQQQANAQFIYSYFTNLGFTMNAICGILGNMQVESSLNPGRWQGDIIGSGGGGGFGLVQWTPYTNYQNWVTTYLSSNDFGNLDYNLQRIKYEYDNGLQYYATTEFPETFAEFRVSNQSIDYLTTAFLKNYERAGVEKLTTRISFANNWFSFLSGTTPTDPEDPEDPVIPTPFCIKRKKFNFIFMNRRKWINDRQGRI